MPSNNFTLKFVGDIAINSKVSENLSQDLIDFLKSDFTIGNLEGPVTLSGRAVYKWAVIKQQPMILNELKKINFNGVFLANNHMFDYGEKGLFDTLRNLKNIGLKYAGAGKNLKEALSPIYIDFNGKTIRVYNIATTLPLASGATNKRPGIAPVNVRCTYYFDGIGLQEQPGTPPITHCFVDGNDLGRIKRLLRKDKNIGSISIVSIHWGMPYQYNIMDYQKYIAHSLIDSGAELIIGHHPHVLQKIEKYKNKYIFYSLGNFIWQPLEKYGRTPPKWNYWPPQFGKWEMSNSSVILDVIFDDEKISYFKLTPVILKDGLPYFPSNEQILSHDLYIMKDKLLPIKDVVLDNNHIILH